MNDSLAVDEDGIPVCECGALCPDWEIAVDRGGVTYPLCERCETQVMWDAVAREGQ